MYGSQIVRHGEMHDYERMDGCSRPSLNLKLYLCNLIMERDRQIERHVDDERMDGCSGERQTIEKHREKLRGIRERYICIIRMDGCSRPSHTVAT